MANNDEKQAQFLKPGDVIVVKNELRLVVSQESPAGSVPKPEAYQYCEPGVVVLKHQREDRWVQTHIFTYMLFLKDEMVTLNNAVRVQVEKRYGKYLDYNERVGETKADD